LLSLKKRQSRWILLLSATIYQKRVEKRARGADWKQERQQPPAGTQEAPAGKREKLR